MRRTGHQGRQNAAGLHHSFKELDYHNLRLAPYHPYSYGVKSGRTHQLLRLCEVIQSWEEGNFAKQKFCQTKKEVSSSTS
jgi:hypothetical protein